MGAGHRHAENMAAHCGIDEIPDAVRIKDAVRAIEELGQYDGGHHKAYALDRVARALLGGRYDEWAVKMKAGEDGPDTYDYDVGIAP